jgi:hypothetical protein
MPTRVVISGSFSRHWTEIAAARERFKRLGASVLAPLGRPGDSDQPIYLASDGWSGEDPVRLLTNYLALIRSADLHYVVCPDGQLGASTLLEIGHALAAGPVVRIDCAPAEQPFRGLLQVASEAQALAAARLRSR